MGFCSSEAFPVFSDKEKKKKKHKGGEKSEKNGIHHKHPRTSPTPSDTAGVDLDKDVPSPPPAPIFKETSKKSGSSINNGAPNSDKTVTTAKQHNYKERSAGVEEGVIKPKPRGSKPAKSTTGKPTTSVASAMASHKRCETVCKGLQSNDLNYGVWCPANNKLTLMLTSFFLLQLEMIIFFYVGKNVNNCYICTKV